MKRLSAISKAAMMALITSAGVPLAGALNHMIHPPKAKKARSNPAFDAEALACAEAKRLRKSNGRNKERV